MRHFTSLYFNFSVRYALKIQCYYYPDKIELLNALLTYCISVYSFRGNYSFLKKENVEIFI